MSTGAAIDGSTWTTNATCAASDGNWWKPIPATSGAAGTKVAFTSVAGTTAGTASLRFGFRAAAGLLPGRYAVPLVMQVQAPNV